MAQEISTQEPLSDYDILECIERGLDKFDSSVKYAVMWRMVVLGDSPKEGILANPKAFVSALRNTFGTTSKVIESEIMDQVKVKADEYSDAQDLEALLTLVRSQS